MALRGVHEEFARDDDVMIGSERSFGLVIAVALAVFGVFPVLSGSAVRLWAIAAAGAFALLGIAAPSVLKPLNHLWFRIGLLLSKVAIPLTFGLIFYGVVTPMAVLMRLAGKDPLRRRFDPEAASYWIDRRPPGPDPKTMRNQF